LIYTASLASLTPCLRFLREISLHISGTGWRSYDKPIGQPVYYSGFSENMKAAVVSTPILQNKISELAAKRVQVEEEQGLLNRDDSMYETNKAARKVAIEHSLLELSEKMTDDMICKMENKTFIRSAYYFCTELLTRAYHQGALRRMAYFTGWTNGVFDNTRHPRVE
jgi:hypothetical protein